MQTLLLPPSLVHFFIAAVPGQSHCPLGLRHPLSFRPHECTAISFVWWALLRLPILPRTRWGGKWDSSPALTAAPLVLFYRIHQCALHRSVLSREAWLSWLFLPSYSTQPSFCVPLRCDCPFCLTASYSRLLNRRTLWMHYWCHEGWVR